MANSELYGEYFSINSPIIKKLVDELVTEFGEKAVVPSHIQKNDYHISYSYAKKLKNMLSNNKDKTFEYNGGSRMKSYIESLLKTNRNKIKLPKKLKKDIGMENQFIKYHSKNKNSKPVKATQGLENMKKERLKLNEMSLNENDEVKVSVVMLFNENKEILLLKRSDTDDWMSGKWGFTGGHVEDGESFEQGAIRETKEESNVDIYKLDEVFRRVEDNHELVFFIAYTKVYKNVKLSNEHSDFKWVKPNELNDLDLIPNTIEDILEGLKQLKEKKLHESISYIVDRYLV